MRTVKDLLAAKPAEVVTVDPGVSVFDALQRMADHDIGALVVIEDARVVGVMSERDYARKVILHHKSSREIPVSEIMTSPAITVGLSETLDQCMALMTDKRIRHLPVLEAGRLIGVLSIGDLVRATISEQAFAIRQLEGYIAS
jgi:CBS domain-containing protein